MAEMLETQPAAEVAEQIDFLKFTTPTEVTILSGSSDGEMAVLQVEGVVEGERAKGEITLLRQDGFWIATEAAWE